MWVRMRTCEYNYQCACEYACYYACDCARGCACACACAIASGVNVNAPTITGMRRTAISNGTMEGNVCTGTRVAAGAGVSGVAEVDAGTGASTCSRAVGTLAGHSLCLSLLLH